MKSLDFYIVDVFAEEKYAGNQLAVVNNAASLSGDQMQQIAGEFNFSETTFIITGKQPNGGYDVRIFTPGTEVPFAGHPTIGTAWVLRHKLGADSGDTVTLNLKVGQIPVQQSNTNLLWMTTKAPEFTEGPDMDTVVKVLELDKDDIDASFPIEVVSTGVAFVLVPLKTLDAVKRTKINLDQLTVMYQTQDVPSTVMVFSRETLYPDNQIHTRMFAPLYGVPEDPATGSANSCLAGYLAKHRYFNSDTIDIQVEQGYEIGRPSRLYLKAKGRDRHIDVQVGGKVQEIAKGLLL